jgi:hypothetical protein
MAACAAHPWQDMPVTIQSHREEERIVQTQTGTTLDRVLQSIDDRRDESVACDAELIRQPSVDPVREPH